MHKMHGTSHDLTEPKHGCKGHYARLHLDTLLEQSFIQTVVPRLRSAYPHVANRTPVLMGVHGRRPQRSTMDIRLTSAAKPTL